jgi:hypothetical protein
MLLAELATLVITGCWAEAAAAKSNKTPATKPIRFMSFS